MVNQARRKAATSKQRHRDLAQREEITKRNAIESPLLRLPPEIRNGIYAYVFGNTLPLSAQQRARRFSRRRQI
ncbi:hypothetical protein AA0118_g12718 [Alternaria tenuissima]|nr:hypothetical protein AA0118_g12718 [Alternaria tenuissima]